MSIVDDNGFSIYKTNPKSNGSIDFYSRETSNSPELIIEVDSESNQPPIAKIVKLQDTVHVGEEYNSKGV